MAFAEDVVASILILAKDEASGTLRKVAGETDAAGESMSKGFGKGKVAAEALVVGLAGAATASIAMAAKFQSSMELVHTQAGASQQEVEKMSKAVLNLSGDVATSPLKLADGLYHIESAGFRGAQALNILHAAAEGAKVGHADLEATTQALIGVTASHISGVKSEADAMAQLNAIVGSGDVRMQDFATAMGSGIMAAGATFGLSLKDVGAAMATLTDNTVHADEASTRLRMTFSLLGAPSGVAIKQLASIGIGATQLATDMRKPEGLLVALEDLKKHLQDSGKTSVEQAAVISRAFGGGRSSAAIMTMLNELDRLKSKYGDIAAGAKNFGQDWEATTRTAQFAAQRLVASVETIGIRIGAVMLPAVTNVINAIGKWVGQVQSAIEKNTDLHVHVQLLGSSFGDLGTKITGLIDALRGYDPKVDGSKGKTNDFGKALADGVGKGLDLVTQLMRLNNAEASAWIGGITNAVNALRPFGDTLKQFAEKIPQDFKDAQAGVQSFFDQLGSMAQTAVTDFDHFQAGVFKALQDATTHLSDFVSKAASDVSSFAANMVSGAQHAASGFISDLASLPGRVSALIGGVVSSAIAAVGRFTSSMISGAQRAASGFISGLSSLPGRVAGLIGQVAATVVIHVATIVQDMISGARQAATGFVSGLQSAVSGTAAVVASIRSTLSSGLEAIASAAVAWGRNIAQGIANGLEAGVSAVAAAAGDVLAAAKKALAFFSPNMLGDDPELWGRNMGRGFAKGLLSTTGFVAQAAQQVLGSAMSILQGAGGTGTTASHATASSGAAALAGMISQLPQQFQAAMKPILDGFIDQLRKAQNDFTAKVQKENQSYGDKLNSYLKSHAESIRHYLADHAIQTKNANDQYLTQLGALFIQQQQAEAEHNVKLTTTLTEHIQKLAAEHGIANSKLHTVLTEWLRDQDAKFQQHLAQLKKTHEEHLTALKAAFQDHANKIGQAMAKLATPAGIWDKLQSQVNNFADGAMKALDLAILEHKGHLKDLTAEVIRAQAAQQKLTQVQADAALRIAKATGDFTGMQSAMQAKLQAALNKAAEEYLKTGTISASTAAHLQALQAKVDGFTTAMNAATAAAQRQASTGTQTATGFQGLAGTSSLLNQAFYGLLDSVMPLGRALQSLLPVMNGLFNGIQAGIAAVNQFTIGTRVGAVAAQQATDGLKHLASATEGLYNKQVAAAQAAYDQALADYENAVAAGVTGDALAQLKAAAIAAGVSLNSLTSVASEIQSAVTAAVNAASQATAAASAATGASSSTPQNGFITAGFPQPSQMQGFNLDVGAPNAQTGTGPAVGWATIAGMQWPVDASGNPLPTQQSIAAGMSPLDFINSIQHSAMVAALGPNASASDQYYWQRFNGGSAYLYTPNTAVVSLPSGQQVAINPSTHGGALPGLGGWTMMGDTTGNDYGPGNLGIAAYGGTASPGAGSPSNPINVQLTGQSATTLTSIDHSLQQQVTDLQTLVAKQNDEIATLKAILKQNNEAVGALAGASSGDTNKYLSANSLYHRQ